jgi:hypothetical protein
MIRDLETLLEPLMRRRVELSHASLCEGALYVLNLHAEHISQHTSDVEEQQGYKHIIELLLSQEC